MDISYSLQVSFECLRKKLALNVQNEMDFISWLYNRYLKFLQSLAFDHRAFIRSEHSAARTVRKKVKLQKSIKLFS